MCLPLCGQGLEEVSRTDIGKKIKEGMEEAAKTAKTSAETVSKGGEMFGKTGAFKALSQVCIVFCVCLFFSFFKVGFLEHNGHVCRSYGSFPLVFRVWRV